MQFVRFSTSTAFLSLLVVFIAGCGSASTGSGTGSGGGSGGSGGGNSFQPRPFPGDFYAAPAPTEYGSTFPGNVVYDSGLQEFFFSNPAMNEVEAYSTVDGHRVGAVSVPAPVGLSLSPDGTQLAVGTSTPHVYFVDPVALHVTGQIEIPASVLDPATGLEPVQPFLMASGPMLIEANNTHSLAGGNGILLSYNPASGAFAQMNPPGASVGVYGAAPARSLDGNYLAVSTLGQTALQMAVYSAESQTYIGTTPGQYNLQAVAANPDGSQFATVGTPSFASGGQYITFWNRSLQQKEQYATEDTNIVYSRDGKYLYAREASDVLALNTQTGLSAGYQGLSTLAPGSLWDTDESYRVYGVSDWGAYVASVAQLQSAVPQMPQFLDNPSWGYLANPNEGPLSGGTQVQLTPVPVATGSSWGISSTMQAYFGLAPATNDVITSSSSSSGNSVIATTPAASSVGPVTVLITDANNNSVLLPAAFSYGTHFHWIDPSAVPSTGGTESTLWGDGILSGFIIPTVTIGGTYAQTAGGEGDYPEVGVVMPPGKPGWADINLSRGDGTSETTKNGVQYLAQDVTLTSAAYTSAVYDSTRDLFYLTGADNTIGVFNPETQALQQPMQSSAVSSSAVLGTLALTPDNSKLLVSDPTDHSLVVFDLTSGTNTSINVLLPSDGTATVSGPMPVAALTGNKAFVLLSGWMVNELREIDLTQMTVQVRTDLASTTVFQNVPSTMVTSMDGSMVLFGGSSPGYNPPFSTWRYESSSDVFSAPMSLSSSMGDEVAINADGTVLGMGTLMLGQDLTPFVPFQFVGNSILLTGSGGLRYNVGGAVQISDTRNGRTLLTLPAVPNTPDSAKAFAIDPTGQKILVCANGSLNYYELAVVPLAVGTVSPVQATPGTTLTISGDGFVAETTATIAGTSASCTMANSQTLQCGVPTVSAGLTPMTLTNPDGQMYSFEAAVTIE